MDDMITPPPHPSTAPHLLLIIVLIRSLLHLPINSLVLFSSPVPADSSGAVCQCVSDVVFYISPAPPCPSVKISTPLSEGRGRGWREGDGGGGVAADPAVLVAFRGQQLND